MEVTEPEHAIGSLIFALLLALVVFLIARRAGYFRLPLPSKARSPVTWVHAFIIFLVYLILGLVLLPLLYAILVRALNINDFVWRSWAQIISLFVIFFSLLGTYFLMRKKVRAYIFWGSEKATAKRTGRALLMGVVSLVVSYPFVFVVAILTSLISFAIWHEAKVEQVAVQQLKRIVDYPYRFGFMAAIVIFFVPFMEELLFRGFLQSAIKRYLGRYWAILLTAIVFALVHFAPSQGTGNFQLISSLFVLALFLGFIYEKERTLWASIGLHSSFNAFSVLLILFD